MNAGLLLLMPNLLFAIDAGLKDSQLNLLMESIFLTQRHSRNLLEIWERKMKKPERLGSKGARTLSKRKAMQTQSLKAKGRRWQQKVVKYILACFLDLEKDDVRSTPMGCSGEDIQLSPKARELFSNSVECKNNERPNLRKAWAQAEANAGQYNPLLFTTWNRGPELVTMRTSHYFNLIKDLREVTNERVDTDDARMV